jgi:hypothetical protein
MNQTQHVSSAVDTFQEFVNKVVEITEFSLNFVHWWSETEDLVRGCKDSLISSDGEGMGAIRVTMLRKDWEDAKERYGEYKVKVGNVFQLLPSLKLNCL